MINRGLDYTDNAKLQKVIRNTQFVGCTGKVSIEKGSNDRIFYAMNIESNRLDENGKVVQFNVGKLRPFDSQLLSILSPMVYPDGSFDKPSDFRNEDLDCPFPDDQIRTFNKGRGLVFGICFGIALITGAITFYI